MNYTNILISKRNKRQSWRLINDTLVAQRIITILFNFLDQGVAIEDVKSHKLDHINPQNFLLVVRFFELVLLFVIYFLIAKSIQFILSTIIDVSMEDIFFVYYVLPILYLMEVGASKLNSVSIKNVIIFLSRASVKFILILGIDKLVMSF